MATINALCLDSLPSLLYQLLEFKQMYGRERVSFTLNILRFPSFQSVTVLPKQMRGWAARGLESWLENNGDSILLHQMEKDHVQRLIDYLNTVDSAHAGASPRENLQEDLKKFLDQYDQRRNKSMTACPEIKGWLYT